MGVLPGSNLEVQDNEKSTDDLTDDLNSYWLQLQTKLNLSESMNAVDLVYCPVFNTSSGGHFACVFLLPAISKAFHMDSLATCGLYELATQVLSPFFAFCLNAEASVIPLLRKDHTAGIEMKARKPKSIQKQQKGNSEKQKRKKRDNLEHNHSHHRAPCHET